MELTEHEQEVLLANPILVFIQWLIVDAQKAADDCHPHAESLARLLDMLYRTKTILGDTCQYVEDLLVDAMPNKTLEVEGIGVLTSRTGAKRTKWDHDSLTSKAAEKMAEQLEAEEGEMVWRDTGEGVNPRSLLAELLREFRTMATPSWKLTGLRQHGIDPDEYCETSWGRKTIEWPKSQEHG